MDIDDAFDPDEEEEMDRILGDEINYFKILDDKPKYELNIKYLFDKNDSASDFLDKDGDFSDAYE
jgi:hypothetical protein